MVDHLWPSQTPQNGSNPILDKQSPHHRIFTKFLALRLGEPRDHEILTTLGALEPLFDNYSRCFSTGSVYPLKKLGLDCCIRLNRKVHKYHVKGFKPGYDLHIG